MTRLSAHQVWIFRAAAVAFACLVAQPVEAADKVAAYRNWLGLCQGALVEVFQKDGKPLTRRLAAGQDPASSARWETGFVGCD